MQIRQHMKALLAKGQTKKFVQRYTKMRYDEMAFTRFYHKKNCNKSEPVMIDKFQVHAAGSLDSRHDRKKLLDIANGLP